MTRFSEETVKIFRNSVIGIVIVALVGTGVVSLMVTHPAAKVTILTTESQQTVVEDKPKYYPMTNDEIISESNKCKAAGFKPTALTLEPTYGSRIVFVQCNPE